MRPRLRVVDQRTPCRSLPLTGCVRLLSWRPGMTAEAMAELARPLQVHASTLRRVEALEYDGVAGSTCCEIGSLEQLDGSMWLVCGIFEPLRPDAPWCIAYAACREAYAVLRVPSVHVAQERVTRVHDAATD